uniref:Uncharacterized protein n=1 Tax=Aegilops tauschii subsp. strangulata TaxID=200361 RepID=A0A453QGZ7_AEGTS
GKNQPTSTTGQRREERPPPRCRGVDPSPHAGSPHGGGRVLRRRRRVVMPRGAQVSTPFASGFLAFSERIWSTPSMQVPLYPTSRCLSKFLAGDFVFTETSLSSPSSIAPEEHTWLSDYRAWSHATGH